jgi:hypothetical protein
METSQIVFQENFLLRKNIIALKNNNKKVSSELLELSKKVNSLNVSIDNAGAGDRPGAGHTRPILNNSHVYFNSSLRNFSN